MLSDENEEQDRMTGLEVTSVEIEASYDGSSSTITGYEKQLEHNNHMISTIDSRSIGQI